MGLDQVRGRGAEAMNVTRTFVLWSVGVLVVVAAGVLVWPRLFGERPPRGLKGHLEAQERADQREDEDAYLETTVRAIHPKQDPSLVISVQQLLTVEPFFEADVRSQVAGVVRSVHKDIGDPVTRGELLLAIDVPDLEHEVAQKESAVIQRLKDVK